MVYLKSLCLNFLLVFFANHILPGIVVEQTKLPHFGSDIIFALALGFLNTLIYPILHVIKQANALKIALICLILNFVVYAAAKFLPIGVKISSVEGYFFASVIVSVGSFLINFFEMKKCTPKTSTFDQ